jgi:hypothetical protein
MFGHTKRGKRQKGVVTGRLHQRRQLLLEGLELNDQFIHLQDAGNHLCMDACERCLYQ